MNGEIDRTDIETDAGTYAVVVHLDEGRSDLNPLTEFDQTGFGYAVFERGRYDYETMNTLTGPAGNAVTTWLADGYDDEDIERRFSLWRAITGDQTELVTYQADADRSTWYRCLALVDYLPDYPDWDRKASALASLKEFESWARGDVYGYVVESPSGDHVDSCWGFIGDESRGEMVQQATDSAEADAAERVSSANVVGSGIVGLI